MGIIMLVRRYVYIKGLLIGELKCTNVPLESCVICCGCKRRNNVARLLLWSSKNTIWKVYFCHSYSIFFIMTHHCNNDTNIHYCFHWNFIDTPPLYSTDNDIKMQNSFWKLSLFAGLLCKYICGKYRAVLLLFHKVWECECGWIRPCTSITMAFYRNWLCELWYPFMGQ